MIAARLPQSAVVQLAGAVILLGASWPVTRVALLDGAAPSWFAVGRAGLSTGVALLAAGATGGVRRPGRTDMPALLALGLLQLAGFFAFAHAAAAWVPAGRTAILSNATLIWTVPIALVVTREAISPRQWVATAVAASGIAVLAGPWAIDWTAGPALIGHAYLLGAAGCWAVAMAVTRRWPPALSMFGLLPWAFALATAALLPMAVLHGPGTWTTSGLLCHAAIGLIMARSAAGA